MLQKVRFFLISNLVAASLLTAACAADSPAEDPTLPGAADETQLEATPAMGETEGMAGAEATSEVVGETEGVVGAEATPAMGETEGMAGAEATSESMGETESVAGAEATSESMGETESIAGAEATSESMGETESVAGAEATPAMGETDQMAAADMSAAKASVLIGHAVRNPQGEDIGQIEDLVIGVDSDQVRYAVLSFGGFLGIGDKLFAIPVQAFNFDPNENVFVLNVTEEQLENAPGFEANNWPDTAAQDWDAEFRDFQWSDPMDTEGMAEPGQDAAQPDQDVAEGTQDQDTAQPGQDVAQTEQGQDATQQSDAFVGEAAVRASEILDFNIEDTQGEGVGEIEDIIVQLDTGNVQYVVVSLDDEIDNSEDFFGLQLSELNFTAENDAFVFDPANQSLLQNAPSFSQDEWDNQFNLELGEATQ